MKTGVTIGNVNTLTQWGLILLDDLKIEAPRLKSVFVDVPGRNGTINMSYVISNGEPVFSDRSITFTLFKRTDDAELSKIREELADLCHGKQQTLVLPTDLHVRYTGIFHVGDITGYNKGKISIEVIARPDITTI